MLDKNPLIVYHANCMDGLVAAYIAKLACDKSNREPEFHAVNYGDNFSDLEVKGREIYFLDFCPSNQFIKKIADQALRIFILDHHKTAQETMFVFEADPLKNLAAVFDMNRSGAGIALDWFFAHHEKTVPPNLKALVDYVQDRDLWTWKMFASKEVSASLWSRVSVAPKDRVEAFAALDELVNRLDMLSTLINEGVAILRYMTQQTEFIAQRAVLVPVFDLNAGLAGAILFEVPLCNATNLFSEVGAKLLELHPNAPFAMYWFLRTNAIIQVGLRSRSTDLNGGYDVSAVAKQFGGGGHRNAAGFEVPIEDFDTLFNLAIS